MPKDFESPFEKAGEPVGKARSASSKTPGPMPRFPPGWAPDAEVSESQKRARSACTEFLVNFCSVETGVLHRTEIEIDGIVKQYWADKRYDEQTSFRIIKSDFDALKHDTVRFQEKIKKLANVSTLILDAKMKRYTNVGSVSYSLQDLSGLLNALRVVLGRALTEIEPKKVATTAVTKCCEALSAIFELSTGKRRQRYAFAERVCKAIDPAIDFKKVRWRIKTATQAESLQK